MSGELLPPAPASVPSKSTSRFLIQRGADLVQLIEDLQVRWFVLTLVVLAFGSVWSVWARLEDSQRGSLALTGVFATLGASAALVGISRRRRVYCWLRYNRARQFLPALTAMVILLVDGPHSAAWWMALGLLFVMASVSSTSLTLLGSIGAAGAYIGGTVLYDSPLIYQGDTGNLVGAAMLIVDVVTARAVVESFGGFVLRLHRLEVQMAASSSAAAPRRVPNLAESSDRPTPVRAAGHPRASAVQALRSVLTARQLEVALLLRDGLQYEEIAACLAISRRQVERLVEQARGRSGAATTSQLVALLVRRNLVPPPAEK